MKRTTAFLLAAGTLLLMQCTPKRTFEQQIKEDLIREMKGGECKQLTRLAEITNVKVGEITPIGDTGLIDVTASFEFKDAGQSGKMNTALLYSKRGDVHKLEKVGSCSSADSTSVTTE